MHIWKRAWLIDKRNEHPKWTENELKYSLKDSRGENSQRVSQFIFRRKKLYIDEKYSITE